MEISQQKLNINFIGITGRSKQTWPNDGRERRRAVRCGCKALGKAAEKYPKAPAISRFRKMIDEATNLDAVVICAPHIHAATASAPKCRENVYCEKPLTDTVWEVRVVGEPAAKHKVTTQHGTNAHAFCDMQLVELIEGSEIGPVREAHVWCDESYGGATRPWIGCPPGHLDLDLFQGLPTALHKAYHPYGWHYYSDLARGPSATWAPTCRSALLG